MDESSLRARTVERWRSLSREQKVSVVILSACGVVALVLSAQRIGSNIVTPFTISRSKLQTAEQKVAATTAVLREDDMARRRDTDGDGLSDYNEEHTYQTSPFMRDTDGDGIPDNVEIATGDDPNCAPGQLCGASKIDLSGLTDSLPALIGVQSNDSNLYAAFQRGMNEGSERVRAQTGSTSTILQPQIVREAGAIRKALVESGKVTASDLDEISDAQLLDLYDQAIVETAKQQAATAAAEVDPNSPQAILLQRAQSE